LQGQVVVDGAVKGEGEGEGRQREKTGRQAKRGMDREGEALGNTGVQAGTAAKHLYLRLQFLSPLPVQIVWT
jgi:hypothetical protein